MTTPPIRYVFRAWCVVKHTDSACITETLLYITYIVQAILYIYVYLLTVIGLTPGGRSTVHIYTQTVHRTTQNKQYIEQHKHFWKSAGRAPSYTLAFALQQKKKHGKPSVRVAEECQLAR